jgi:hypothetical protein
MPSNFASASFSFLIASIFLSFYRSNKYRRTTIVFPSLILVDQFASQFKFEIE